jgi:hypothetical protein
MGFAVSARVSPCPYLLSGMTCLCCAVFVFGAVVAVSVVYSHIPDLIRACLACLLFLCSVFAYRTLRVVTREVWIAVNDAGQLSVAVAHTTLARHSVSMMRAMSATLLANSTFLPYVMLWRIQLESGQILNVLILPWAISREQYRRLSVTGRQILGRIPFG